MENVATTSFTVLTRNRVVTVDVTPATIFRLGASAATYSDVSAGSEVRIFGVYDRPTATLHAVAVVVRPPPTVELAGSVQTIGTTWFTFLQRGKSFTADVNSTTKFHYYRGPFVATFLDLAAGDWVRVHAVRTTTAGTVNAIDVAIVVPKTVRFTGFITSIGTNNFMVLRGHRNVTVDVSTSTSYNIPGTKDATFAVLAVGDPVKVDATVTSTAGTFNGHAVLVVTQQPNPIFGEVSSVGTNSFTVVHKQKILTVDVNPGTQYFQFPSGAVSFSKITMGDRVLFAATRTSIAGTVDAGWIVIFAAS